jgi:P pilus assembly chaperone PapD
MPSRQVKGRVILAALLFGVVATPAAHAEIVLSQVIVDLQPGQLPREDVEIFNSGTERAYVLAEPAEIVDAGLDSQQRVTNADPEKLGILVTPNRLILEPGQRRLLRVAMIGRRGDRERVYRITVKPVAGELEDEKTALKILLGYDMLVIARPAAPNLDVTGTRDGSGLTLRNTGNTSVELFDGQQCDADGRNCAELPAKRLYAGAAWRQDLSKSTPAEYSVKTGSKTVRRRF